MAHTSKVYGSPAPASKASQRAAHLIETAPCLLLLPVAFLLIVFGFATAAKACEPVTATSPLTVSYTVTDDPATAAALGIPLTDNLDYELDHEANVTFDDTDTPVGAYCEHLGLSTDAGVLDWYECYDIPVNEAPRPLPAP